MTPDKPPAGFRDIEVRAEASSIEKWRKQVLDWSTRNWPHVCIHQR